MDGVVHAESHPDYGGDEVEGVQVHAHRVGDPRHVDHGEHDAALGVDSIEKFWLEF